MNYSFFANIHFTFLLIEVYHKEEFMRDAVRQNIFDHVLLNAKTISVFSRFPKVLAEGHSAGLWVGSLKTCFSSKYKVMNYIWAPLYDVLSCLHQIDNLVLKS